MITGIPTPDQLAHFTRGREAMAKAWQECRDAGDSLPVGHCGCSTCQGYYINVLKRLPREFGGYAGDPLPDPQLEEIKRLGT